MKRLLAGIVVFALVNSPRPGHAAGPNLVLDHYPSSLKDDHTTTLDYSLHVTNPGSTAISDLTLSLMPRPFFVRKMVTLRIGNLAPKQEVTLPLQVVTPVPVHPGWASTVPLYWAGRYLDADGKAVDFPAVSKGGAR